MGRNISIMGEHEQSESTNSSATASRSSAGDSSVESPDGGVVSAAELRRRVRAQERQRSAAKLAVAEAVRRSRARSERLRAELAEATRAEAEALAAALRVFGTAADVSEVTGIAVDQVERGAKGVRAERAAQVADEAAAKVPRPRGAARQRR